MVVLPLSFVVVVDIVAMVILDTLILNYSLLVVYFFKILDYSYQNYYLFCLRDVIFFAITMHMFLKLSRKHQDGLARDTVEKITHKISKGHL
jgi:hypothetical protein